MHVSTPKVDDGKNKHQRFEFHYIHQNYVRYCHFLYCEDKKVATYSSQELSAEKQVLQHDAAEKKSKSLYIPILKLSLFHNGLQWANLP
jgi:hypothetical protein